jgi:hypothetical protein
MIRAALAQSGSRFSSGQTPGVCPEIMLKQKDENVLQPFEEEAAPRQ